MNKSEIAREYRSKYPDYPTHKLARIMYKENNLVFTNTEDARQKLRYIEGKAGQKDRGFVTNTTFFMATPRPVTPYSLPKSYEEDYTPFILNHKRILLLSDIHIPYHSIEALTATLDYAKKEKPDAIVLNGDTIDCHKLSRFCNDPRARNFAQELEDFREFFTLLQSIFNVPIYFKVGNHEERYDHFLFQKAGELVGVEEFSLEQIIKKRADCTVIGDKKIMKAGGLDIIHGHEFASSVFSPVNVARGLYLRGKVSAIQGHNHQTSEHTETDMNGKIVTTWSLGCLCGLHPNYMPINKWNHGFAIIDVSGDDFDVRNKRIYKGKIL